MFPMTPVQSWSFLILLAALLITSIWLVREVISRLTPVEEQPTGTTIDAEVICHRRPRRRHVVPDSLDDEDDLLSVWREVLDS